MLTDFVMLKYNVARPKEVSIVTLHKHARSGVKQSFCLSVCLSTEITQCTQVKKLLKCDNNIVNTKISASVYLIGLTKCFSSLIVHLCLIKRQYSPPF